MPSPTDSDLARGINQGDPLAFKELFLRYHDDLYRYVFRRVGDDPVSADLVQDVFVRVWERRSSLDPHRSVRALIYRAAGNLIIDHHRHGEIRRAHLQGAEERVVRPEAEFLFVKQDVSEAIKGLPDLQREAFVMSRYDGLSYSEIAEVLGVSVKAVEKRMSLALRHLRKSLAHLLSVWVIWMAFTARGW